MNDPEKVNGIHGDIQSESIQIKIPLQDNHNICVM